ncbi:DUF6096 family protein [Candidatus Galacturonibacter soehngenii]|nr:DUF6096 family protein [Candidatus Galacturonibacter soehngenii]
MGFFDKDTEATMPEEQKEVVVKMEDAIKKRSPFAYWEVDGESYKLKLKTSTIVELETKFKINLIELMKGEDSSGTQALSIMLEITHAAMKEWHHGIKLKDVLDMFEKYVDEGGSQFSFYINVYLKIFTVSGFFPQALAADMEKGLEETRKELEMM